MSDGFDKVELRIPDSLRYQLVYRTEISAVPAVDGGEKAAEFVFLAGAGQAQRKRSLLTKTFGALAAVKIILKLMSGKRQLYGFVRDGRMVHYGWLNLGFCKHYQVDAEDVVIGPIWSDESARGEGLATHAMAQAMGVCLNAGGSSRVFHIDTARDNIACQKAIERVGFGAPVAVYLRGRR